MVSPNFAPILFCPPILFVSILSLILDEATSSLDSESEKVVFEKIKELYKDKTIIFISHRLSTIKNVDEIIFINDGKIIEKGTHENLIQLKGYYYNLFQEQLNSKMTPKNVLI